MAKIGDQFLINDSVFGERVIVCVGRFSFEDNQFVEIHEGKVVPGISVTFSDEDLKNGCGVFNLRPIDDTHPKYFKGWEELPDVKVGALLKKAEQDEASGKSEDAIMDELTSGMLGLTEELMSGMTGFAAPEQKTRRPRKRK